LGGSAGTQEVTDAVCAELEKVFGVAPMKKA
jgi:hypothetical protein